MDIVEHRNLPQFQNYLHRVYRLKWNYLPSCKWDHSSVAILGVVLTQWRSHPRTHPARQNTSILVSWLDATRTRADLLQVSPTHTHHRLDSQEGYFQIVANINNCIVKDYGKLHQYYITTMIQPLWQFLSLPFRSLDYVFIAPPDIRIVWLLIDSLWSVLYVLSILLLLVIFSHIPLPFLFKYRENEPRNNKMTYLYLIRFVA